VIQAGAEAARRQTAPDVVGANGAELGPTEFGAIAKIMQSDARIHLAPGKVTLVQSRLNRRVRKHGLSSFKDYVKLVHADAEERRAMVVALTTNHTHFFREGHHFDHLRETAMPWLQRQAQSKPLRIWSAGCSSGEEVYSIAMCLRGPDRGSAAWLDRADVKLLATDLSPIVVETARRGVYPANAVQPIPAPYRASWLRPQDGEFAVADEVRAMVTARVLNLFDPWPMRQKYDVIFCRNVMIYFDDVAKAELEARFVDLLVPGGYLYIGHSERLIGAAAGAMKPAGHTIYVKQAR
jgi:chemotaxis protein methyltransferase CheR